MMENPKYNEIIREIRLDKGWSQKKVCQELSKHNYNITRSTYTKYESGQRQLSALAVEKLALCFKVSADMILGIEKKR